MRYRRNRRKPLRKDLQEIVDRVISTRPAVPRPADFSGPAESKGATPEIPPAISRGYKNFLRDLPWKSLVRLAQERYFKLDSEERQIVRDRLGFTSKDMCDWINASPGDFEKAEKEGLPKTFEAWVIAIRARYPDIRFNFSGRTDPRGPEGKTT